MVLFKQRSNDIGEFRTPGRMWESIHGIPDNPKDGSDMDVQVRLIDALFRVEGVEGIAFEDGTILIDTLGLSWDELRPKIEATIQGFVTA